MPHDIFSAKKINDCKYTCTKNKNEYENENENENENEVYFEQPKQKTRKKRVTFRNNKSKGNRKL